jgi:hypothetical protein
LVVFWVVDFFNLPKSKTGFLDFDDCFRGYAVVFFDCWVCDCADGCFVLKTQEIVKKILFIGSNPTLETRIAQMK